MNRTIVVVLVVLAVLTVIAVACLCVIGGVVYFVSQNPEGFEFNYTLSPSDLGKEQPGALPTHTPRFAQPTTPRDTPFPSDGGVITPTIDSGAVSTDTLQVLDHTTVPINDLLDLAGRLEGKRNIPPTLAAPPQPLEVGAQQSFWVVDSNDNKSNQVQATLRYITDHLYFWIQDGLDYDQKDLKKLADTFEKKIYPTDREFFGSEWTPGIDSDPHLYILYTQGLGGSVAGYYSSADEYPPQASEYSNGHEMFMLSADLVTLDEEYAYTVLAHEFQHMIHWYRDRNEESWVNEGFSELASFLNGYGVGGHDSSYTDNPDMQLNDWPNDPDARTPNYGASFLFMTYFLDRFGEKATQAVVGAPENGLVSIDKVLTELAITDPLTGRTVTADDVFSDWVVASYLKDGKVSDGRFTYHNYKDAPQSSPTESIRSCPTNTETRDVSQYGVDYIRIRCRGDYSLHFDGALQVGVLPIDARSGSYAFWSNKGDESDMTLTRTFDFSQVTGTISINYWTWYDLEKDYDYLYLLASLDGNNWQILKTPSGTDNDPAGNSYGWGYNGISGGDTTLGAQWIEESVDLTQFAGKKVQLRFEYITDAAVNGEGLLLDDISIPQINYTTNFDQDDGGWQAAGFVRIRNILPQTFRLSLITRGKTTTVQSISLSPQNQTDIPLKIGKDVDEVVLVVSGTTRFTRQKAAYRFNIR